MRPEAKLFGAWALVFALGGAQLGCDLPANAKHPRLLTFADLETLVDGSKPGATFAESGGVPEGLRVSDYITKTGDQYGLKLRNTWTEAYRSAYVTAEIWQGFDEVWVQPAYVPITGFDKATGKAIPLAAPGMTAWSPIFSVGAKSAFYSPFWQIYYFQVPATTDPELYTSARKVLDAGLPLIKGPARTLSLVPDDKIALPIVPKDPIIGGPQVVASGYLDGQVAHFLDFGTDNFSWNDHLVVDETPLFVLVYRDTAGTLHRMNVPTVAGTGPLYTSRPPNILANIPHYGSYWRLYTVEVPATARIFAPAAFMDERADYPAAFLSDSYGADVLATDPGDLAEWLGRVTLNEGCFDMLAKIDTRDPGNLAIGHCRWLDSQPAIEQAIPPDWIKRTDILVTCPFVSYDDFAVTP